MFVAEMIDCSERREETHISGRIRMLEDTTGNGVYDKEHDLRRQSAVADGKVFSATLRNHWSARHRTSFISKTPRATAMPIAPGAFHWLRGGRGSHECSGDRERFHRGEWTTHPRRDEHAGRRGEIAQASRVRGGFAPTQFVLDPRTMIVTSGRQRSTLARATTIGGSTSHAITMITHHCSCMTTNTPRAIRFTPCPPTCKASAWTARRRKCFASARRNNGG